MKKAIFAALLLAGCAPAPPQYGGLTEIGVTEMAVRLDCPFDNVRIQNMQKGFTTATWDAVCTAPRKVLRCENPFSGNVTCKPK